MGEEAIVDLYEKTKKKINDEFFPDRGFGKMRLAEAKMQFRISKNYQAVNSKR